ncbi:exodeoxyribonuclease V subunit beta [Enterobacteriaceae endosymbiont of Neohaemonia nigricornis]|uniref:exodeoxyribonuclease V subunit beta n=1 Tax=Enterobacteriaceae endosymbiont of Neohaemonia nigricornis TaxID=2675792 RepID=UPI001449FC23|nr:exodeoxyribonuclease V subunit beta [Enterobacteriaceae endosymbiont of Neohaemonia nigricornis]QJC30581.1 exodeoxyribonuclease V subunit beta [Enterobacteriaceae endosymbiont of Neohaemonia nigricornis]
MINYKCIKEFDLFIKKLTGKYLIEASAGTGKTFTIIIIYLRLILGLITYNNCNTPLKIEQILVVTFTEISVKHLRKRIKNSIYLLRQACINNTSENNIINLLIKEIKNLNQAKTLLLQAELNFHKASIFTIHSFCQKILNMYHYNIFTTNIINNEFYLLNEAIIQFWHDYINKLPEYISIIIFIYFRTPQQILQSILPFINHYSTSIIKYHTDNINVCKQYDNNKKNLIIIKKYWIQYHQDIIIIINNSDINKHMYNKRNMQKWINIVNVWANNNIYDTYPTQLKKFSRQILINNSIKYPPKHILFNKIDICIKNIISLKNIIILQALKYVVNFIQIKKKKDNKISFNDLLNLLLKRLNSKFGVKIAQDIRKIYPITFIDEFQDTNTQQYNIFKKIYNKSTNPIIFIGDPKQAIYSFRDADIFTYIQATKEIKNCYTLKNNWRSSSTIVKSINQLFSNRSQTFVLKNIIFNQATYVQHKINYKFIFNNDIQPGINLWLDLYETNINKFKQRIAYICVSNIYKYLISNNNYFLYGTNKKIVNINDITILVRNKYEAYIIQKEFIKFNIPSIYLSNTISVFETIEAKELIILLKTIIKPSNKYLIIKLLSSTLFEINLIFFDYPNKYKLILKTMEQFFIYKKFWNKYGFLNMLEYMFLNKNIYDKQNILYFFNKKKIKNILHIGELLQNSIDNTTNVVHVIQWLKKQITYPNNQDENQQIRLDNQKNQIKIMTIYKSKGLQFPIVWLPFIICNFVDLIHDHGVIYHNRSNFNKIISFNKNINYIKYTLEESLSEHIRLLYVSITRAIFHCSIGIANLKNHCQYKKYFNYFNALHYLIKNKNNSTTEDLKNNVNKLITDDIKVIINDNVKLLQTKNYYVQYQTLNNLNNINDYKEYNIKYKNLDIISYTKIKKQQLYNTNDTKYFYNFYFIQNKKKYIKKTQHNFPIGKTTGLLIHSILEKINFQNPVSKSFIKNELIKNNINISWDIMLTNWINNIINKSLSYTNIILKNINSKNKQTEFEFYLSIKNNISSQKFNNIIKKYDNISYYLPLINFNEFQGFIHGVIDLIFIWEDKYYIIDYKSHWLGSNVYKYNIKNMKQNICYNRYDIQYQLYTVALHKYLSSKIINYNYNKYFGAIIYLYVRGINKKIDNYNGIWITKPKFELIHALEKLFN